MGAEGRRAEGRRRPGRGPLRGSDPEASAAARSVTRAGLGRQGHGRAALRRRSRAGGEARESLRRPRAGDRARGGRRRRPHRHHHVALRAAAQPAEAGGEAHHPQRPGRRHAHPALQHQEARTSLEGMRRPQGKAILPY